MIFLRYSFTPKLRGFILFGHFTICHFQTLLDEKEGLFCVIFIYFDLNHLKSSKMGTISQYIRSLMKIMLA